MATSFRFSYLKLITVLVAVSALLFLLLPKSPTRPITQPPGDADRGEYLLAISGCFGCHTDIENEGDALAGGKPVNTPFGNFYGPNITPDKNHGIGNWSLAQFSAAVREGLSPEGVPYYPVFPYTHFTGMSDQDVSDLWAAIKDRVPPSDQANKEHDLKFPFDIRPLMNAWRFMFFTNTPSKSDPSQPTAYQRGGYIVEVLAHCGACHTPRNLLGASIEDMAYQGGVDGAGNEVPAIDPASLAEKGWTALDLEYALETGIMLDGDTFGGSMTDVVEHGTTFLTAEDLAAIATYLLEDN